MRTVIYGLPKSGTTYLFSLLAQAMSRDKKLVESFEPRSKDENNRLHRHDGQFWDESENMLVKILYADANKNSGWEGAQAKKSFDYYDKKISNILILISLSSVIIQVLVVIVYQSMGNEIGSFSMFYNVINLFILTFLYIYRNEMNLNYYLYWSFALLFLMGMEIRALQTLKLGLLDGI